jgi:hypothetical protein
MAGFLGNQDDLLDEPVPHEFLTNTLGTMAESHLSG